MLHIISTNSGHDVLLQRLNPDDSVLFVESAVLSLHKSSQSAKTILIYGQTMHFYALQADLLARGLAEDRVLDIVKLIDFQGFVTLTTEHPAIKSWR